MQHPVVSVQLENEKGVLYVFGNKAHVDSPLFKKSIITFLEQLKKQTTKYKSIDLAFREKKKYTFSNEQLKHILISYNFIQRSK